MKDMAVYVEQAMATRICQPIPGKQYDESNEQLLGFFCYHKEVMCSPATRASLGRITQAVMNRFWWNLGEA